MFWCLNAWCFESRISYCRTEQLFIQFPTRTILIQERTNLSNEFWPTLYLRQNFCYKLLLLSMQDSRFHLSDRIHRWVPQYGILHSCSISTAMRQYWQDGESSGFLRDSGLQDKHCEGYWRPQMPSLISYEAIDIKLTPLARGKYFLNFFKKRLPDFRRLQVSRWGLRIGSHQTRLILNYSTTAPNQFIRLIQIAGYELQRYNLKPSRKSAGWKMHDEMRAIICICIYSGGNVHTFVWTNVHLLCMDTVHSKNCFKSQTVDRRSAVELALKLLRDIWHLESYQKQPRRSIGSSQFLLILLIWNGSCLRWQPSHWYPRKRVRWLIL